MGGPIPFGNQTLFMKKTCASAGVIDYFYTDSGCTTAYSAMPNGGTTPLACTADGSVWKKFECAATGGQEGTYQMYTTSDCSGTPQQTGNMVLGYCETETPTVN